MRLYEIEKNPTLAFNYLERQVNDGSKSGFTNIHTTSLQTNPFYSDGYYIMKLMIIPGLFEPPVRTLRATIPENESHIFR